MTSNFGFTATSWASTLSRVSTVGGVLKEIKQERTLKNHEDMVQSWRDIAIKNNNKIFNSRKIKKDQRNMKD